MIYKTLKVRRVVIPAGQVVGAPLGTVRFRGTYEEVGPEMRYTGIKGLIPEQTVYDASIGRERSLSIRWGLGTRIMQLDVSRNTFIELKGTYHNTPLVLMESSWGPYPKVGNPMVHAPSDRLVTAMPQGGAMSYAPEAYILLQDLVFSGEIILRNTVNDRDTPFRFPLPLDGVAYVPLLDELGELSSTFRYTDVQDEETLEIWLRWKRTLRHQPSNILMADAQGGQADVSGLPALIDNGLLTHLTVKSMDLLNSVSILTSPVEAGAVEVRRASGSASSVPVEAKWVPVPTDYWSQYAIAGQWLGVDRSNRPAFIGENSGTVMNRMDIPGVFLQFEVAGVRGATVALPVSPAFLMSTTQAQDYRYHSDPQPSTMALWRGCRCLGIEPMVLGPLGISNPEIAALGMTQMGVEAVSLTRSLTDTSVFQVLTPWDVLGQYPALVTALLSEEAVGTVQLSELVAPLWLARPSVMGVRVN